MRSCSVVLFIWGGGRREVSSTFRKVSDAVPADNRRSFVPSATLDPVLQNMFLQTKRVYRRHPCRGCAKGCNPCGPDAIARRSGQSNGFIVLGLHMLLQPSPKQQSMMRPPKIQSINSTLAIQEPRKSWHVMVLCVAWVGVHTPTTQRP